MRVADMMQTEVVAVPPETPLVEIILTLADAHVSALPVVDARGRLLGVVSHADVMLAEAEAGDADSRAEWLRTTLARDIMTPRALTIGPEATLREAAQQMLYSEVHRLFVAAEGRLVGVISTTDLVRAIATGKL